jgi:Protein of unknown function (DUF1488)
MPLTPDPSREFVVSQFDPVKFAMFHGKKRVLCSASWESLQDRAALDGTNQADVGGTFQRHRSEIERIASQHYDRGETLPLVRTGEF